MMRAWRKGIACFLSFCLTLGMAQAMAWGAVNVKAADGSVEESGEGTLAVRYLTGEEGKEFNQEPESHPDRVSDFFAGTESMTWSAEFQTTDTKLQALFTLENNDNYFVVYLKSGNQLGMEVKNPGFSGVGEASYADGEWHKAELEIIKGEAAVLKLDGEEAARVESPVCVKDLAWTPDAFTIGGMNYYASKDGWSFQGKVRNVVCTKKALRSMEPVWERANLPDERILTGQDMQEGSIQMSYRLKKASDKEVTLLSVGGSEIYVNPAQKKLGMKSDGKSVEKDVSDIGLGTVKWHNLTVTKETSRLTFYLDGEQLGESGFDGSIDMSSIQKGADVHCSKAQLYEGALQEDQISELHAGTKFSKYPDQTEKLEGYFKGDNREIFNAGFDGSVAYRIPAIATSKKTGTVFASIDKRWITNADTGINDTVVRRSKDNGETWGPVIPVIDMQDDCAYTIDPEIVVDNDPDSPHYGRVYILVDMMRRGVSLWECEAGSGYQEIDGAYCQILRDADNNTYTVRENGTVYDSSGSKTDYQVETKAQAPYQKQGSLYKAGKYVGSIYKNAELTMVNTCYLWMAYSDDDGLSWSLPKDITPMVKADWMTFFGTGPGAGAQLQSGRLIFTAYCMTTANSNQHFSSYNVYTDDHGETWHRGASPNDKSETDNAQNSTRELNESCIVELDNGHLIQFMKNATAEVAMAVSTTQGESWGEVTYAEGIREVYCEMSVVHYGDLYDPADGQTKEAIIFANPSGTTGNGRNHGRVRIAFVNDDDTLDWAYDKLIEEKNFLYTSLTVMEDGKIGLIYENEKGSSTAAAFTSFSPQYIMDPNRYENTPQPTAITAKILTPSGEEVHEPAPGNMLHMEVTFDDIVFASGNVTLNLTAGDEKREAGLIGNVDERTLAFSYQVQENDRGALKALAEVNIKEGGVAETVYNVRLTDKPFVTKAVTAGKVSSGAFAELPKEGMSASAGSENDGGAAENVLDGDPGTLWHTKYSDDEDKASNGGRPKHWITIDLGGSYLVSGLSYLPRQDGGNNGTVTEYQIELSADGEAFYPYDRGEWAKSSDEKTVEFAYGPSVAAYVRLRALETKDDFASAAEIRIFGSSQTQGAVSRIGLVRELLSYDAYADVLYASYPNLFHAMDAAKELLTSPSVSQQQVDSALSALQEAGAESLKNVEGDLAAAIADKEKRDPSAYNITSWNAYQAAYEAAKSLTGESSAEEKRDAFFALKAAEKALVMLDSDGNPINPGKPVTKITVTAAGNKTELTVGEKLQLSAAVEPEDAKDGTVAWMSSDASIAAVSETGEVVAMGEGEVTVTASARDGSGKKGRIKLTVKASPKKPVTGIQISAALGQTTLTVGDTVKLTAAIAPQDASDKSVIWSSGNPKAASVDQNGLVKALAEGDVTITAKAADGSNVSGSVTLKVVAKLPGVSAVVVLENRRYKITASTPSKKTVALVKSLKKNKKAVTVKADVEIEGHRYQITKIGAKAFQKDKKMKQLTIGPNVKLIEGSAFAGCSNLKKVTILSKNITKFGKNAFKGIKKDAVIYVPKKKLRQYKAWLKKDAKLPKTVKVKAK